MFTNNASSYFKSIVTQNFFVVSFMLMILVIESLLYHTPWWYGMSHLWCAFIIFTFVLMLNGLSESHMFEKYLVLQKTVTVKSLSNRIISFVFTDWANEQFNPYHPITISYFFIDKLLMFVILLTLFLECTCCWYLCVSHSSFGMLSLFLLFGYLCPGFPQQ